MVVFKHKTWYNNPVLTSTEKKNKTNRRQCVTWTFESRKHYQLWKAREIIKENIKILIIFKWLLKYQKQGITAALNREDAFTLLPSALRKLWIYQVLPLAVSREILHQSRIWCLIWNFTGVPIMNFIPDWESVTVNQSCLQIHSLKNWCYCKKKRAL